MRYVILSIFILAITACEPEADLARVFKISEGEHYSTPRIVQSMHSNILTFEATFDASAMYDFEQEGFQDSKNKLLGFADCNAQHHDNSARFAWQWYNDRLEIFAYCYVNGERKEAFIGVVNIHEVNRYSISIHDGYYAFQINGLDPVLVDRGQGCGRGVYYMLWPYFGGTLPAPHDVFVKIKIIN